MTNLTRRALLGATTALGLTFALPAAAQEDGRDFVLVHGSWFGGWVWDDLATELEAQGHEVTAPTLSGLGDRAGEPSKIDLSTHIDDVVAHTEENDLTDVDLVGWSYGGMVVTGVVARIPDRIASLTYLDAFVPQPGQSIVDIFGPLGEQLYGANRDGDIDIDPLPMQALGVFDPALIEAVTPRLTRQPWRTYFEAATVADVPPQIPTTYVLFRWPETPFEPFYQFAQSVPFIEAVELEASHLAMLEKPQELAAILTR